MIENRYLFIKRNDMMKIYKLIVIAIMMLVCRNGMYGQGSPGGYAFAGAISDSLSTPVRMAIDNMDNIYVTDAFQKKIRKFNSAGTYLYSVVNVGAPVSIAVNAANQMYIGDGENGKIYKINSNGTRTELYAGTVFPSSMVFCSDGNLYVSDSKLQRIIVLDLAGNVVRTIGAGTLTCPTGITFDKKNNRILVAEHGGIGNGFNPVVKIRIYGLTGNLITSFGSHGNEDGKFYRIQGLAVGRCGEIYVPEPYQGNVSVFSENTVFATRFGQYGDSTSQLRVPLDIAINSQDKIFITAENNGTIEIFDIDYLLPASNITCGNQSICEGTTAEIPVHFTGTAPWSFTYTVNGANPVTIGSTSDNPYLLTVSAPGNYQVTALSDSLHAGTCFSGNSIISVNNVIPASAMTLGAMSFCTGQPAGIPIEFTGVAPWTFTYTVNGTNPQTVSNVLTSPYLLNVTEAGNYQVTALMGAGCPGSVFTGNTMVTANISPEAILASGNTAICDGESASLSIGFTGTAPWSVTYTRNNATPATITDIVDNPYLLHVSAAGSYQVTQVQDANCEGTASGIHEINVKDLPTANISSGNTFYCPGDSAYIIIDFTGKSPWAFTYTLNGVNPVGVSRVTASPYVLAVSGAGTYQLSAVSDAGCNGTSFTGAAIITENPLPFVSLGPPVALCEGDSIVIEPGTPYVTYLWSDSTEGPSVTAYSAGIYSVTITDNYGCRNSASKTVTPEVMPTSAITSGNADLCSGETTDLSVSLTGTPPWAITYTVNGYNPLTVSNITASSYLLNVYQPGLYEITETTDANCRNPLSSGSAFISVHPLPAYNFSSGNAFICAGQTTNIVIDLTGTPPWNFTFTVNGSNPATLSGINASPYILPVSHGGTYEIIALSDAFCHGPAHNGTITVTEKPLPVVDLGPDITIVEGEPTVLDATSFFAGYLWSDGSTGQTLQVSTAGTYRVTVTDYDGCSNAGFINVITVAVPANRDLQNITITGLQCFSAIQTITVAGSGSEFIVTSSGSATLIAGLNILFLPGTRVDSSGYMHAYITSDNTYCGGMVPPMVATLNMTTPALLSTGNRPLENILKLYPNPSTGLITLEINNPNGQELQIGIFDMAGRHLFSKTVSSKHLTEQVDLGRFPGGFYMVKLSSGSLTKITKLVLID